MADAYSMIFWIIIELVSLSFLKHGLKKIAPNLEGILEETIDRVFNKAKIYRDKPETWKRQTCKEER